MSKICLNGFLADLHSPSESNLECEVNCSNITWEKYRTLIIELSNILSDIDKGHSVKGWTTRGRSLKSKYKRIAANENTRRMRFSPFPSSYSNTLTNTRSHVYSLLRQHCIVLEHIGNRKVYLLPKNVAPAFIEIVEALNTDVVEKLNKKIGEFTQTNDFAAVQQSLSQKGVDTLPLKSNGFHIGEFRVDVTPVDLGYNVDSDAYYKSRSKDQALKGLELLKKQVEHKQRERQINAMHDLVMRVAAMADEFDHAQTVRFIRAKLDKLIDVCAGLGITKISEELLKPVRKICDADKSIRKQLMKEQFGTESLRKASQNYLKIETD